MLISVLWAIVFAYLDGDNITDLLALYNFLATNKHIRLESLELWKSWEDTGTFLTTSISISIPTIETLAIRYGLLSLQHPRAISLNLPNLKSLIVHVSFFFPCMGKETMSTLTKIERLEIDFCRIFYKAKKYHRFYQFPRLDLPHIKIIEVRSFKLTSSIANDLLKRYKSLQKIISHEFFSPTIYTRQGR